ncbi:unnamed protein product [Nyctereutes procyonoides]|uniref:(raccoon dog) hypothetical protein n=1 Tax=Nyctereutes procyonoides TaxID=34880 RepID=A0A811YUR7_NYCPR|nr:unnamed protein product [Nyctereutes procyonoides]
MAAFLRARGADYAILSQECRLLFADNFASEDKTETLLKPSVNVSDYSPLAFVSPETPQTSLAMRDVTKEGTMKPASGKKDNGVDIIESAPQEQAVNDNLTSADRAHKNNTSDRMSALGEEDSSPWDSESISARFPKKSVDCLPGAADQQGQSIFNEQVEDSPGKDLHWESTAKVKDSVPNEGVATSDKQTSMSDSSDWDSSLSLSNETCQRTGDLKVDNKCPFVSQPMIKNDSASTEFGQTTLVDKENISIGAVFQLENSMLHGLYLSSEPDLEVASEQEQEQERPDESENNHPQPAAAAAPPAAPAAGLIQQRKSGKTDNHLFPTTQNEDSDRPAKKTSKEKNKVKKQVNSVEHLDGLTQSSEAASEHCMLQYSDYKSSLLPIGQLDMDCKDSVSILTTQDAIFKYRRLIELKTKDCEQLIRKILKMEYKVNGLQKELSEAKEMKSQLEHQKVEWERELYSLREQLRSKEEQHSKEVEMKQQLNLRRRNLELKSGKSNWSQIEMSHTKMNSEVSPPHEKEKGLLHENRMLQDEIAALRLEIDTIRNQKQEKEKKYCEDTEIEKEKNDSLQNAIKLNDVTLNNTVFQSSGQLNVVTPENTMLNSKLQDERLNRERLEAKLQSYRARLTTAVQDHDQSQASKRDLELAFQRAKDEWCHLQGKMNFEMSNLKDNNEVLSQQLSEAKSKFNTLEIELQYQRDALREKTLALEHVQGNLKQTQDQKMEIEQKSQNEQDKVNKYIGKHKSLEERLSQPQSENTLLREQLDDGYSRVECKEKTRIDLKDQVQVIVRTLQAEREKQSLILQERNKELINEWKHLIERIYTYKKEKEGREVQEAEDQHTKIVRCIEKSRDHEKKLEVENAKLKVTIKEQAGEIEQLQKDLLSSSSCGDEKENLKKCMELTQSLQFRLDQEVKKNEELEKENTGSYSCPLTGDISISSQWFCHWVKFQWRYRNIQSRARLFLVLGHVKDLYAENYRTLMKEIEDDIKKWKNILFSFVSVLWFSESRSFTSFVRCVPRYRIIFDTIVNSIVFLISLSAASLLVYRNATDFCTLIFIIPSSSIHVEANGGYLSFLMADIRYLGINLTKEVKDLYPKNYRTLLKEIEEDTKRSGHSFCFSFSIKWNSFWPGSSLLELSSWHISFSVNFFAEIFRDEGLKQHI